MFLTLLVYKVQWFTLCLLDCNELTKTFKVFLKNKVIENITFEGLWDLPKFVYSQTKVLEVQETIQEHENHWVSVVFLIWKFDKTKT